MLRSIKSYEGLRLTVYKDSLGYPTVGYGHLVHPRDDLKLGEKISLERAEELFQHDLETAKADALLLVSNLYDLHPVAREVLFNLSFNLGYKKLSKFVMTLSAFRRKKYKEAAKGLQNSLWYKQVKLRGKEIVEALMEIE